MEEMYQKMVTYMEEIRNHPSFAKKNYQNPVIYFDNNRMYAQIYHMRKRDLDSLESYINEKNIPITIVTVKDGLPNNNNKLTNKYYKS